MDDSASTSRHDCIGAVDHDERETAEGACGGHALWAAKNGPTAHVERHGTGLRPQRGAPACELPQGAAAGLEGSG